MTVKLSFPYNLANRIIMYALTILKQILDELVETPVSSENMSIQIIKWLESLTQPLLTQNLQETYPLCHSRPVVAKFFDLPDFCKIKVLVGPTQDAHIFSGHLLFVECGISF